MSTYQLIAEPRTLKGKKVKQLRAQGYVPVVLYGTAVEPKSLQITRRALEPVMRDAGSTNLISIQIGSKEKTHTVVVRDIQYDVIRRTIEHVDFMQIVMGEKISIEVSIILEGDDLVGGTVYQDLNSLQVECLPSEMISSITVDTSALSLDGDTITVKDLQVPDSLTILADEDLLVAHTEALRAEEEEEVATPVSEVEEVELISDRSSDEAEY